MLNERYEIRPGYAVLSGYSLEDLACGPCAAAAAVSGVEEISMSGLGAYTPSYMKSFGLPASFFNSPLPKPQALPAPGATQPVVVPTVPSSTVPTNAWAKLAMQAGRSSEQANGAFAPSTVVPTTQPVSVLPKVALPAVSVELKQNKDCLELITDRGTKIRSCGYVMPSEKKEYYRQLFPAIEKMGKPVPAALRAELSGLGAAYDDLRRRQLGARAKSVPAPVLPKPPAWRGVPAKYQWAAHLEGLGADPMLDNTKSASQAAMGAKSKAEIHEVRARALANKAARIQGAAGTASEAVIEAAKGQRARNVYQRLLDYLRAKKGEIKARKNGDAKTATKKRIEANTAVTAARAVAEQPVAVPIPENPDLEYMNPAPGGDHSSYLSGLGATIQDYMKKAQSTVAQQSQAATQAVQSAAAQAQQLPPHRDSNGMCFDSKYYKVRDLPAGTRRCTAEEAARYGVRGQTPAQQTQQQPPQPEASWMDQFRQSIPPMPSLPDLQIPGSQPSPTPAPGSGQIVAPPPAQLSIGAKIADAFKSPAAKMGLIAAGAAIGGLVLVKALRK